MKQSSQPIPVTITKLPHSQISIAGTLPPERLEQYRAKAIKALGAEITLPGFRKGHIPEKVLIEKIGEMAILEEMAQYSLGDAYPEIVISNHIEPLGRPSVQITKLVPGNPFEFTLTTAVYPEFTLPDYKKIAKKVSVNKEAVKVDDQEIVKTELEVRRLKARIDANQLKKVDGQIDTDEEIPLDDASLPELTDEFVTSLGEFKDVEDFRSKLRENIRLEKENQHKSKQRASLIDAIVKETPIDLPHLITEGELDRMWHEFDAEVSRAGSTIDAYLAEAKKTAEEIRTEWTPGAEHRGKTQLILNKIAVEEKLTLDESRVVTETERLVKQYSDADPIRVRNYVESILMNEAVFALLDGVE